jgi:hypothetical protein
MITLALMAGRQGFGQDEILGTVYEAPLASITIDGQLGDWADIGGGVLSHSQRGDGSNVPLEVAIRWAWDQTYLYTLVQETRPDDDRVEGEDAFDWTFDSQASTGPSVPWGTDSVGFYDVPGEDSGINPTLDDQTGPVTQFWIGLSSSTDADQIRHQARLFPENGSTDFLIEGDAANHVDNNLRAVEFRMLWEDIRYDRNDPEAIDGHTLQDVGVGYTFRNDPLVVDGVGDGSQYHGQSYPGGATHPNRVLPEDVSFVRLISNVPQLRAGDANQDLKFDQLDLVRVQIAAKYLTGQVATWGEGDWNGAPGGRPGAPPAGDGRFNQIDIIAALGAGTYLTGPYAAVGAGGQPGDGQASMGYDAGTGEVWVDAPGGIELTSVNIDSKAGIFTGSPADNLGGSFDHDADNNIFKATFGSSFGSLSFGNVAQAGLTEEFVLNDLTVIGSLAGGGGLGNVDLIYVPEPSTMVLLLAGMCGLMMTTRRRHGVNRNVA